MSGFSWPYAYPSKDVKPMGQSRVYQGNKDATAGAPDNIIIPLSIKGRITRVELDAAAVTEYFKYVDCYVRSPEPSGYAIRLASGQLLPMRDARLIEHCDVSVQPQSQITASFYGITAGTRIFVTVNVVEE